MNAPRLALVARRFWPLVGDTERLLAAMADALASTGASVTVVTGRQRGGWPTRFFYRRTRVVRLNYRTGRLFRSYRFERMLARWLRRHRESLDGVIVSSLGHESTVVLKALAGSSLPVIVRAETGGPVGDASRLAGRKGKQLADRLRAAHVVAPCEAIAAELRRAGVEAERLHVIANGAAPPEGERVAKTAARLALAEAHPILAVDERAPLAIADAPLHDAASLAPLIDAWAEIARRYPGGRMWLTGDTRGAEKVWDRITHRDMREQIILPGTFDDLDDVFAAADLFLATGDRIPAPNSLLQAMAAALPVLAADSPAARETLGGGGGIVLPPGDATAWHDAILDVIDHSERAALLGEAAHRRAAERYSIADTAARHLELIARLVSR